jgi:undecaprenyl-diphosphatase
MILSREGTRLRTGLAALLSFLVLCLIFWGLFQIDLPFARFLRSLHIGWLEQTGDIGTRLGSGAALIAISVGLLLGGTLWKQAHVQKTGIKTLLAHGIAAIAVQVLKHGIGRPRPRLIHADNGFPWRPSVESGLDSFPSGHTTASFAVATVFAKSFPRIAWIAYGLAGFVAVSRAVRGSHFPTDVIAGICLGTLVGISVATPIREWKQSMGDMMAQLLPCLVLIFSLLWIMTHLPQPLTANFMMAGGGIVMATGVGMRMYRQIRRSSVLIPVAPGLMLANALIVIGLALTTGVWLVAALAGMLCLIQWLVQSEGGARYSRLERATPCSVGHQIVVEIPLMAALLLAVLTIQQIQGLLPLL